MALSCSAAVVASSDVTLSESKVNFSTSEAGVVMVRVMPPGGIRMRCCQLVRGRLSLVLHTLRSSTGVPSSEDAWLSALVIQPADVSASSAGKLSVLKLVFTQMVAILHNEDGKSNLETCNIARQQHDDHYMHGVTEVHKATRMTT